MVWRMNVKDAAAIAKNHICDVFAVASPSDLRLEGFLYDDHLMVWSLTIGFAGNAISGGARPAKLVRVSEANKSVLSTCDQP